MKKWILWIMTAGLLLLAACRTGSTVEPNPTPEQMYTPTPTVVPTCTPIVEPTKEPVAVPTTPVQPSPVETEAPTVTPMPSPSPLPTETLTSSPSPSPTGTPTPSPSPSPTVTPTPSPSPLPTATPMPSPSPSPTVTPTPSPLPLPTATPTPEINPEPLVGNGWQKTVSIDEKKIIIFPDLFRDSYLTKTDREISIDYLCREDAEIGFTIGYKMQQTLEESLEEINPEDGIIIEQFPEERKAYYYLKVKDKMYQGLLQEGQYSRALLGNVFGKEEWITGVMNVMFCYPVDRSSEYDTEKYCYYVIENREE